MIRLFISLLALSFLFVHVDSITDFRIHGYFVCDKPDFAYYLVLREKDTFSADDVIRTHGPSPARSPPYYSIIGQQDGDEAFSYYHEVYLDIGHNCTHSKEPYRKLIVPLGDFEIGLFPDYYRTYARQVNITLTNQGELTTKIDA